MASAGSSTGGILVLASTIINSQTSSTAANVRPRSSVALVHASSPVSSSSTIISTSVDLDDDDDSRSRGATVDRKFSYSRASPSVRWPHLKLSNDKPIRHAAPVVAVMEEEEEEDGMTDSSDDDIKAQVGEGFSKSAEEVDDDTLEILGRPSRTRAKKMTKLALKRAKDWRERVQFFTDRILGLKAEEFVADVLDDRMVQMTPTDFCYVVKWVGKSSWQRAMEVYEWLNLRHWYSPNARMLATILSVLGKANQEALAVKMFTRTELSVFNTVQVYNAMMGVYARNGRFSKVKELLDLMQTHGCEPDLVSFNTLINARLRSGPMGPNLATELLNEVRKSGLRADIITYNTLISACSRESNLEEAAKVYDDMEAQGCQPDLWTYNAMISVYGRCGVPNRAEQLFRDLESKGFLPDAVTYNSLLYAFARDGKVEKVKEIREAMVKVGLGKDEMTYNTMIHMYGKQGQNETALQLYKEMKMSGRNPDVVTYTVLIDSLGKVNKTSEAAQVMSEMLDAGVKPTLRTFSSLICGYGKAGKRVEAEETYNCMLRSGIRPDKLAYSVMIDIFIRSDETTKVMSLYHKMVHDGFTPDHLLYQGILHLLGKEMNEKGIEQLIKDMEELCGMNPQVISSVLVKGKCYVQAARILRSAITQGYELDRENLLLILGEFSSSDRLSEARDLLDFLKRHATESHKLVSECLVVMLCKAQDLEAALDEYSTAREYGSSSRSLPMYECLIECCIRKEMFAEASQVYSDMKFNGIDPSENLFRSLVSLYCKIGFPETAHHITDLAEMKGFTIDDIPVYVALIEAYGKSKLWQKAESVVGNFKQRYSTMDRKVWNALIQAYAVSGCYERARAIFNTMMRDGPCPTVDSINGLLEALIIDGRLDELYVVIQELQDMGFKISKSSIMLMLDAFAREGNVFEVKKIYQGMKAAGYFPTMHLYRVMIGLMSRGKRVRDVEAMIAEMEEAGLKPDLSVWNSVLKLYTAVGNFKMTSEVYKKIQETGLKPDEDTYNTLILMYCRDLRPEEGLSLMHEMRKLCLNPKLDTYKSLIAAFAKQQNNEPAEEIFEELRMEGYKLDRSFYHIMLKMFRNCGNHSKAENVMVLMKEDGLEPTIATMHLLMLSFGSSGHPEEAEKVLDNWKQTGLVVTTLPYSSVIDSYLKNGDYSIGIRKLVEMRKDGLVADHRIWTCFIRAASLCQRTCEAMVLLDALRDAGFDLPSRLLTEKSDALVSEVDKCLEYLQPIEDDAAFNFVNALGDLLWAFERRSTASWVFQLAITRRIYCHDVFRVADKEWGADFRKLSAGSALVGLTLWLDHMQDASLQGFPESPKSVVLITGTAEYNMVSLNSTLKAYLWEMGSPFLPCKTRSGLLVAKAHSLRMWLKESPFCLDLELKDASAVPELNSMQLLDGCFIRRGLVPAFKEITERLGQVWPKKFAKLALLSDERREKAITADIEGRLQKLEKLEKRVGSTSPRKRKKFQTRKPVQRPLISGPGDSDLKRTSLLYSHSNF